jgi:hypothetical protein
MRLVIRLTTPRWVIALQQGWCARKGPHGQLVIGRNHLSVFCPACGAESAGLDLETHRIRMLWMWDRHRQRWHTRRRA